MDSFREPDETTHTNIPVLTPPQPVPTIPDGAWARIAAEQQRMIPSWDIVEATQSQPPEHVTNPERGYYTDYPTTRVSRESNRPVDPIPPIPQLPTNLELSTQAEAPSPVVEPTHVHPEPPGAAWWYYPQPPATRPTNPEDMTPEQADVAARIIRTETNSPEYLEAEMARIRNGIREARSHYRLDVVANLISSMIPNPRPSTPSPEHPQLY